MNKKIIGAVIVVLLIIGAGLLFAMRKAPIQNSNSAAVPTTAANPTNGTSMTQGSLKSLMMAGKSVMCTFSNSTPSSQGTGTVYVANGKMRGDFKSSGSGTATAGHMIVDSQYSYVWTDASTQGMKMAVNTAISPAPQNPNSPSKSSAPDLNQSYKYNCQPFTATAATFALPANITFQTIVIPSGVPAASSANPTNTTGNMCAACDNIPAGAARDSCKTQLHCQ